MIQRHEEPDYWCWEYDCPHFGTEYMATGCHETDSGLQECEVCEKEFEVEVEVEYDPIYSTSKVEG
ncbi:hypothetical protein NVP1187O_211 [Vibrio phage 1.187.O._10N.286.49.F1]|nr:hypothetical protein NVP1187O_211 [Vibrio phage 1.187.O._10N.286.49.F1]